MADDLGYTDVACFGSKYYETPNIDKLASQGMKLTNSSSLPELPADACGADERAIWSAHGVYTVGGIDRFDWSTRPLRPGGQCDELPLDRK
jgi:hypothetical protein